MSSDPINDDLPSEPTPALAPAAIERKTRKRGGVKKKPKAKTRRLSWHLALFEAIAPAVTPIIKATLANSAGVKSLADFHRLFQTEHNCSIDRDLFNDLVFRDPDLAALFSRASLIQLPTPSPNLQVPRQTPNLSFDDQDPSLEDTPPGPLDVNFNPLPTRGVGPGSTPAAGVAAASSPWVPPPDPMIPVVDRSGRPITSI